MLPLQRIKQLIAELHITSGTDRTTENLAATVHLINAHRVVEAVAFEQSSSGVADCGIDAWFIEEQTETLYLYQSKLTEAGKSASSGFLDLGKAWEWLSKMFLQEKLPIPNEPSVQNLRVQLAKRFKTIKFVRLILLSASAHHFLELCSERKELLKKVGESSLNKILATRGGTVTVDSQFYATNEQPPLYFGNYNVDTFPETRIDVSPTSYMKIGYVSLASLVELFRRRGNELFHKNVRLSLGAAKASVTLVRHPMEQTLTDIVTGCLAPEMFTFYHLGITLCALSEEDSSPTSLALDQPYILNGCQTVTTAASFSDSLQKKHSEQELENFRKIKVLAKLIVNMKTDDLRDVTNCNNRQNPIEPWQLFSNDDVHIKLEHAFKDMGFFYERQKGKFEASFSNSTEMMPFHNTNGVAIKIVELAQLLCVIRGSWQLAAKPSDVFVQRKTHDEVFSKEMFADLASIALCYNLFKASKRSMTNCLKNGNYLAEDVRALDKPATRVILWRLGMLKGLADSKILKISHAQAKLHKGALPILVQQLDPVYRKVIPETMTFYKQYMVEGKLDVPSKERNTFFHKQALEMGVVGSPHPFKVSEKKGKEQK